MKIDRALIAKCGLPTHKPPKGFRYVGGVFAHREPRKGSHAWDLGDAFCLWCGHLHPVVQGTSIRPEYHFEGCAAWDVMV